YGAVYFLCNMLANKGESIEGKTAVISGAGNVATHAAEKLVQMGGKVLTLSDSDGFVYDPDGIDSDKIAWVKHLKTVKRGRISEYVDEFPNAQYHEGERPWNVPCDLALPCATQNELDEGEAKALVENGCMAISEGANMPTTLAGVKVFHDARILYGPGKAANAGGVAVSGLEMSQNSERISWNQERLGDMLTDLMKDIHAKCVEYGRVDDGYVDYVKGANIAGFKKVADAMLAFGVV
ncbi:MAG: glutamate dehydrogenase, partial [Erythrobacter sp.]